MPVPDAVAARGPAGRRCSPVPLDAPLQVAAPPMVQFAAIVGHIVGVAAGLWPSVQGGARLLQCRRHPAGQGQERSAPQPQREPSRASVLNGAPQDMQLRSLINVTSTPRPARRGGHAG